MSRTVRVVRSAAWALVALAIALLVVLTARGFRPAPEPPHAGATAPPTHRPPPAPSALPTEGVATVSVEVGDDLAAMVRRHPPGTTYELAPGIHRTPTVVPRDGDRFRGAPGAILSGARVLAPADFVEQDGRWVIAEQTQEGFRHGKVLEGHERVAHPEDLFVDGVRYRHVGSVAEVEPGTWHLDYGRDELWVAADPASLGVIEATVTDAAFAGSGARDVTIENLVIQHYASPAQRGAIDARESPDWTVRHVEFRDNHAIGLYVGPRMTVHHSRFVGNGQLGIGGNTGGEPLLIHSNEITGNRSLGFDWEWEGGATKFVRTRDMVFANNWVHENDGPGPWFDIDNRDAVICGNLVEDNLMGIFYEISFGARIFGNIIRDNDGGEGDVSAGLFISNSSDVEVYDNVLSGSSVGVRGFHIPRSAGDEGGYVLRDLHVHDNDIEQRAWSGVDVSDQVEDALDTVLFERNRYRVPDPGGEHWRWDDKVDWETWQALGNDREGNVLTGGAVVLPSGTPGFEATTYGPIEDVDAPPTTPAAARCGDLSR